jgi:hypothetical protein
MHVVNSIYSDASVQFMPVVVVFVVFVVMHQHSGAAISVRRQKQCMLVNL